MDQIHYYEMELNLSSLVTQTHSQHSQRVPQSPDRKLETGFSFQRTHDQIFEDGIQFTTICGVSIEYQLKFENQISPNY